jgi:hypothetical protein
MTCEKAFNEYLSLDKDERIPLSVTLHLLVCPVCRTGVRKLTRAEKVLAAPLVPVLAKDSVSDPVVAAAMARIVSSGLVYQPVQDEECQITLVRWFIAGVALAAGFAVIPFTSVGEWSKFVFGTSFSVPFYLLCGIAVAVYGGLFIGTNIDFFVKKFGIEHSA